VDTQQLGRLFGHVRQNDVIIDANLTLAPLGEVFYVFS
jgi:hypothetical protein